LYSAPVLTDFEFWTLKDGADEVTRISCTPSARGQRELWLVPKAEADADILKLNGGSLRLQAEHVELTRLAREELRAASIAARKSDAHSDR